MRHFASLVAGKLIVLTMVLPAFAADAPAQDVFERGATLHFGEVDVRLDESSSRWNSARQGNIDLNRNTFLFGRQDTYRAIDTHNGISEPELGTTVGVGLGFTF